MSERSFSDVSPAGPELLRRFAEAADQSAFEMMVRRHGGWMTATAGRMTGDEALAQEIVQDAFTLLARKRPLFPAEAAMSAWLHRTVVLLARNQLAKLRRRERKHFLFAHEHPADGGSQESPPVSVPSTKALRLLDSLIETLPAPDRRLIIGRYFQDLSWASLAAGDRSGADAARKRAERILQRLAADFRSRGVMLSVTGLTLLLTDQTPAAALSAVKASSMAAASAAAAGQFFHRTLLAHTLAVINTSRTAILVTTALSALLFSVPVALLSQHLKTVEQQAAAAIQARDDGLERLKQAAVPGSPGSGAGLRAAGFSTGAADTSGIPGASGALGKIGKNLAGVAAGAAGPVDAVNHSLIEAVEAIMEETDPVLRSAGLQFLMQWLRPVDVAAVQNALRAGQKPGILYVAEINAFRERWAQLDGRAAMEDYVKGDTTKAYNRLHSAVVRGWASADPDGLMAWMNALPPECDWKVKASGDILKGLIQKDPARATELLLKSDPRSIAAGLPSIADRVLQEQGPDGLGKWLQGLPATPGTDPARARVAFQLVESQAFRDPQAAIDCLKSFDHESWGGSILAAQLGSRFGQYSPDKALAMLDLLPAASPLAVSLSSALFSSMSASQPNVTASWLNAHPDSPYADGAAETLALAVNPSDPGSAQAWALKIRQESHRGEVLKKLADPAGASAHPAPPATAPVVGP